MFSVVFIDVPATLDPAAVTTMVARCEQVLGVGRCRRGGGAFEPPGDRYYARLQSDAKLQTAKVELHLSTPEGEVIAERDLAFSAQDAPESRWVTVGLVVAGLIAAREANAAAPDSARRPAPPTAVVPHVEPEKSALWGADLGAVGGPGFAGGPYRLGGFGRFWHRLRPAPHLLLLGSVRYAARSGDLSARWMSVGAGLGVRLGGRHSPVSMDITGEVVAERMSVTAKLATAEATDSAAQARFGGRINLSLCLQLTEFAGLLVGADATGLTPPVKVEVQNEMVGREPSGRAALTGGLRVEL